MKRLLIILSIATSFGVAMVYCRPIYQGEYTEGSSIPQVTSVAILDEDSLINEILKREEKYEEGTSRGMLSPEGDSIEDKFHEVTNQVRVEEYNPQTAQPTAPDQIFQAVEDQAKFPGGQAALNHWISNNLRYPESAKQNDIQGRVIVRFVIEKDGWVSNPTVLRGVDRELDKEALRVVLKMPRWIPGKNNGEAVRSYFTLPVTFKLPKEYPKDSEG